MTLFELVRLLKLEEQLLIPAPDNIGNLKIINEEDTCRNASKSYLTSISFIEDIVRIMNKIIFVQLQASPLLTDFALKFTRGKEEDLHLELVYK